MELSSLVILTDKETTIQEGKNIRNINAGKKVRAGHLGCLVTLLKKEVNQPIRVQAKTHTFSRAQCRRPVFASSND